MEERPGPGLPPGRAPEPGTVAYASAAGRWVLLAAVLGSGVAALDATVVNVALPSIGHDLGGGVAGLQWTLNGYLLTLSSLILVGGALGDRFGRRRIFVLGVAWFAAASLLCGLAPTLPVLVGARALQGVGGALLTPGSLALIQATFRPADRPRAIGAWSGLGGIATAVGPLVGGWMVSALSWRVIFLLNLPLALVTVAVASRHVPESTDPTALGPVDLPGALLGAVGLAGTTYALIEGPGGSAGSLAVLAAGMGLVALAAFLVVEARSRHPMLPLEIFSSGQFRGANLVTLALYSALGGALFLFVVDLQQVLGYSPLEAGLALLPVTVVMLVLSPRAGRLAQRVGPRLPMAVGPLVAGVGLFLMGDVGAGSRYVGDVLPPVVVFALGIGLTVAPLTATVLAAVDPRHAGLASGVNNAVARVAALLAVAVLPAVAGLTGEDFRDPAAFSAGFRVASRVAAALATVGGLVAWITIRPETPVSPRLGREHHCAVGGPPLRPAYD